MLDINSLEINKIKDISNIDIDSSYFHYTNKNNINSIFEKGLIPDKGRNSINIEKTEKVFFSIGQKGVLVLMDSWIRYIIAENTVNIKILNHNISLSKISHFLLKFPIKPKKLLITY